MDFDKLAALAERYMRKRKAHVEREVGSIYFHGQRVAKEVLELRRRLTHDASRDDVLRAAGMFHDIGKGIEPHAASGAALVKELLKDEMTAEELFEVSRLISLHCDRRGDKNDFWARILQDADLLDHCGSYEIWMGVMATSFYFDASIEELYKFYKCEFPKKARDNRALLNFPESIRIYDDKTRFINLFTERLGTEAAGGFVI